MLKGLVISSFIQPKMKKKKKETNIDTDILCVCVCVLEALEARALL